MLPMTYTYALCVKNREIMLYGLYLNVSPTCTSFNSTSDSSITDSSGFFNHIDHFTIKSKKEGKQGNYREAGRRTAMLSDAVARSSVGAVAVCTASLTTTCSRATTTIEASRHTIFWEFNICQHKILLLLLLKYRQVPRFVRNDMIEP